MEQQRKPDRRIQRTIKLLREALIELIIEKGYDDVSIQDITDRANVARTTFYLHFRSKDELLFEGMREIYEELLASIPLPTSPAEFFDGTGMDKTADWEHVAENADFYRVIMGEHGSAAFITRLHGFLADLFEHKFLRPCLPEGHQPAMPLGIIAQFMASAQIGLYMWWLENDLQPPAEEMAHIGEQLSLPSLVQALGFAQERK